MLKSRISAQADLPMQIRINALTADHTARQAVAAASVPHNPTTHQIDLHCTPTKHV
jgi:hypothetical protein